MSNIYMFRALTMEGAEKFEKALSGEVGQIGNESYVEDFYLSTAQVDPDYSDKSPDMIEKIENFAQRTNDVNSFFFYGDDVTECMQNLETLVFQPTSEDAIERIESGSYGKEDCFGRDRVAVVGIAVPEAVFDLWAEYGLVGLGVGHYEQDGAQEQINEVMVGDDAIYWAIANNCVVYYDEMKKAFDEINGVTIDPDNIFDNEFMPEMTINNIERELSVVEEVKLNEKLKDSLINYIKGEKAQTIENTSKADNNPYQEDKEMSNAYDAIINGNYSEEEKKFLLEALGAVSAPELEEDLMER